VRSHAYRNTPLPIGYEQTISQPYIVALMTDLLDVRPEHVVLEVGTGSGYQAAVLGELVRQVYTIEIVVPLAEQAKRQLAELGYGNVSVRAGDGYLGWPEHGPFDRIIVTAGASHVPQPLIEQLKPGGRMVIPVGRSINRLDLTVVEKGKNGKLKRRRILPVAFVPLTRAR
jgi:protein-L-isoaspartate(D-aspartate) O-methyltransferase